MCAGRTLSGRVRFAEPLVAGGILHVRVEDVSRIDAAAPTVAEIEIPIDHDMAAGAELPFELVLPELDEHAAYSARVHLDQNRSGALSPGDRISTAAYPVLTRGNPDQVLVEARSI